MVDEADNEKRKERGEKSKGFIVDLYSRPRLRQGVLLDKQEPIEKEMTQSG